MSLYKKVDELLEVLLSIFSDEEKRAFKKAADGDLLQCCRPVLVDFIKTHFLRSGENKELLADCGTTNMDEAVAAILKAVKKKL